MKSTMEIHRLAVQKAKEIKPLGDQTDIIKGIEAGYILGYNGNGDTDNAVDPVE